MNAFIAFLLAGIALSGPLLPRAIAEADDLPHVRADGRRLMFGWHGGAPHRVDVSTMIGAASLETARVLLAQRRGDVDYFVVSVSGPTRAGSSTASNTGGTESNLLWLKLKSWKLIDHQTRLYQSFWDSREPVGDYHLKGGILTLRYAIKRDTSNYVLRYDSSQPDDRIVLKSAGDVE